MNFVEDDEEVDDLRLVWGDRIVWSELMTGERLVWGDLFTVTGAVSADSIGVQ